MRTTPGAAQAAPRRKPAFIPKTIYRVRRNPYSDREEKLICCKPMSLGENGRAKKWAGSAFRGRRRNAGRLGQLNAGGADRGTGKGTVRKGTGTARNWTDDTFSIYQLKDGDETRDYRFEPPTTACRRQGLPLTRRTISASLYRAPCAGNVP